MQKLTSLFNKVSPAKKLFMQPVARSFNRSMKPPVSNTGSYMLMGAGLTGMAYLTYTSMNMSKNQAQYASKGETFMSPLVQKRVAKTLGYFGFGLGFTSLVAFGLRNSAAAMNLHWGICLAGVIGFQLGTRAFSYND